MEIGDFAAAWRSRIDFETILEGFSALPSGS